MDTSRWNDYEAPCRMAGPVYYVGATHLAACLIHSPKLLLLDEPTRGLDYLQKDALGKILRDLRAGGTTILLATHDVELAAQIADNALILEEGEVVANGPTRDVMLQNPHFASQVSRLFSDPALITVDDVSSAECEVQSTS